MLVKDAGGERVQLRATQMKTQLDRRGLDEVAVGGPVPLHDVVDVVGGDRSTIGLRESFDDVTLRVEAFDVNGTPGGVAG